MGIFAAYNTGEEILSMAFYLLTYEITYALNSFFSYVIIIYHSIRLLYACLL